MRKIKYAEWKDIKTAIKKDGHFLTVSDKYLGELSYLDFNEIYRFHDYYISLTNNDLINIPYQDSFHSFTQLAQQNQYTIYHNHHSLSVDGHSFIKFFIITDLSEFAYVNQENETIMSQMNIIYEDEYNYYKNKATNEIFNSMIKNNYQYDDVELRKQLTKAVDIDMISYIKSQKGF